MWNAIKKWWAGPPSRRHRHVQVVHAKSHSHWQIVAPNGQTCAVSPNFSTPKHADDSAIQEGSDSCREVRGLLQDERTSARLDTKE